MAKVVFIGAGSLGFTRGLVRDLLSFPLLRDSTIALVDINKERLTFAKRMIEKIVAMGNYPAKVIATMDRTEVLKGADAVCVTILCGSTNVLSTATLKGVNPFAWKPGETITQSAEFAYPKNSKGTKLALGVFTKEALTNPDVKLGIDQGTARNWYVLSNMARGE